MKLLGKPVTKEIYSELKEQIHNEKLNPVLELMMIGNDPAAEYYVNMLKKKGAKVGVEVKFTKLNAAITEGELLEKIESLNVDDNVDGIMIQKPLPKNIDDEKIAKKISPMKDVDGFNPLNIGNLILDQDAFIPCTPAAVLKMLNFYEIETEGKNITVIGRSNIVGKPLANLLLRKNKTGNATVTVCHSRTKDLKLHTKNADIVIAAIGIANFIKKDFLKDDAIVIDVGMNEITLESGKNKYVGDVDYKSCFNKVSKITPVPGGVGSVTTALLISNVVKASRIKK